MPAAALRAGHPGRLRARGAARAAASVPGLAQMKAALSFSLAPFWVFYTKGPCSDSC